MRLALLACSLLAAVVPLYEPRPSAVPEAAFPGWPSSFDGQALVPLPLTERERGFQDSFPGRIARFQVGAREVILRWVHRPTRTLHPAADCFRGSGYAIEPLPLWVDDEARSWNRFRASKGDETLLVSERIHDGAGRAWTDVSAWYWAALLQPGDESSEPGRTGGTWWSVVVAERVGPDSSPGR